MARKTKEGNKRNGTKEQINYNIFILFGSGIEKTKSSLLVFCNAL